MGGPQRLDTAAVLPPRDLDEESRVEAEIEASKRARLQALMQSNATAKSERVEALRETIPTRFRFAKRSDCLPEQANKLERIDAWLQSDAWLLLIFGPVGTGKTWLGTMALLEAVEKGGMTWAWVDNGTFVQSLSRCLDDGSGAGRYVESLKSVDVLLWDDYGKGLRVAGSEGRGEWFVQQSSAVLDFRYDDLRRTILTTNLSDAQRQSLDERTADRIAHGTGAVRIGMGGKSLRRNN